jgi:protein involved in polysaccharide export with SLBB domain
LQIIAAGEPALSGRYRVGADGTIDFPLVGRLSLRNLDARGVEAAIGNSLRAFGLRNPRIRVGIEKHAPPPLAPPPPRIWRRPLAT